MNSVHVLHSSIVPEGLQFQYWEALEKRGLIQTRFMDTEDAGVVTAFNVLRNSQNLVFYAWDELEDAVMAECTLCNFMGLAAQIHFSIHPKYFGTKGVHIAKKALNVFFNTKRTDSDLPLVQCIYGLTPVTNKLAIRYLRNVGFEEKGVLPGACYIAKTDTYTDAIMSLARI